MLQLAFKKYDAAGVPLVVLHGLFGTGDNWAAFARGMQAAGKAVFAVDLPNHGRSPWVSPISYAAIAQNVADFIAEQAIEGCAVLGHSMGGKVAMQLALTRPDLVAHLIVADIAMRKNPLQAQQSYAEAMLRMNLAELTNRNEADEALAAQGVPDEGIRQFLLKSLTRNEQGSFAWRFNLKGLHAELEAIGEGIVQDALFLGPTLFVRGRQSNYVLPSDEGEILQHFPSAHIETINGAGHWLHADKPAEFLAMIKEELGV